MGGAMKKPGKTQITVTSTPLRVRERPEIESTPYLIATAGALQNRIFYLPPERVLTLGRSEDSFLQLEDEQVSRRHCLLERKGDTVFLRDLNSTNGTQVNGERIVEVALRDGDRLTVGGSQFTFQVPTTVGGAATGLSLKSHAYFEQRLEEEIDRAGRFQRSCALLMVFEDQSGREGEQREDLLAIVAKVLRPMDIVGLYGKGQLEVLLPESGPEEARRVAENLATGAPVTLRERLSIGFAAFPSDAQRKEVLIERARRAMIRARSREGMGIEQGGEGKVRRLTLPATRIIFKNEKMLQIAELVQRIAPTGISVLIQGETGVGKEIIAQAIHHNSPRNKEPLISLNCAALPEGLLESELFGHERGAFTGAESAKPGMFEAAHRGTIFLDEVGEMSGRTQVKLLRVLQTHKVMRVGSTQERTADVRVIAATNRNLERAIESGDFREDLFYRLNAITLNIPPLRDRREEIPHLVGVFLEEFAAVYGKRMLELSGDVLELMLQYDWPGNIRELRNCIERAVVLTEGSTILREHLPTKIFQYHQEQRTKVRRKEGGEALTYFSNDAAAEGGLAGNLKQAMDDYERDLIVQALERCSDNQTKAAELLKIPRRTLVSKIRKYGLS